MLPWVVKVKFCSIDGFCESIGSSCINVIIAWKDAISNSPARNVDA